MNKVLSAVIVVFLSVATMGQSECGSAPPSSDTIQRQQQERILAEGSAQVGMPAVKNFREKKFAKDIIELRDQEGLVTYTYLFSELRGCLVPFGNTVGYPLPYATQFTNPAKIETSQVNVGYAILPQADPNGLFSPASAEATWSLMKDPGGSDTGVVYSEPRLVVMPFKADESSICSRQ